MRSATPVGADIFTDSHLPPDDDHLPPDEKLLPTDDQHDDRSSHQDEDQLQLLPRKNKSISSI
jgi:hypothetical protein